jgi:hypothetical protein
MNMSIRITITLSDFAFRKLGVWAALHDRPKASFASQIVEAEIEKSSQLVGELLLDEAKHQGLTVEELQAKYLNSKKEDED